MFSELTAEQSRQVIDTMQVFETLQDARAELDERYVGSMFWVTAKSRKYLRRTVKGVATALGAENEQTRAIFKAFTEGRERFKETRKHCQERLESMARVNRALRIGRVPRVAARLLRRLDDAGILGRQIKIVGTNALFAFEAAAAVQLRSDVLATGDLDLLFDARRRLRLIGDADHRTLMNILRKSDRSFRARRAGAYSAVNSKGYMVDLIAPAAKLLARSDAQGRAESIAALADEEDEDLVAVGIDGLVWLENAPPFEQTAFGEDGRPVRISTIDPRIFAAHKLWLSNRPDRERVKRGRDRLQAQAAYILARDHLDLSFADHSALSACPSLMITALDDAFGKS